MTSTTCDICFEPVKKPYVGVSLRGNIYSSFDLCDVCALPVMIFLKDKKLLRIPVIQNNSQKETDEVS